MDKNIVLGLVFVAFILGFFTSNYYRNNSNFGSVDSVIVANDDAEYYKYIFGYVYLLDEADYESAQKTLNTLEEDEKMKEEMMRAILGVVFKANPDFKQRIAELIKDIKSKKTNISYFEQNTSCSSLEPSIKSGLNSIREKLEVIFYSPTLDTCLYVVSTSVDYSKPDDSGYKKIFKTGTNALITSYEVYNIDEYKDSDIKKRTDSGKRSFVKYVLENSNYNISLLENLEYIYIN